MPDAIDAEVVSHSTNMWQRVKWQQLQYCSMTVECIECGREGGGDSDIVVAELQGGYGPVCNECWADSLHDETVLSEREADVAALLVLDIPMVAREMGDVLGIEESTVHTYVDRIDEKIKRAHRTVDEIGWLRG